jgi:hypothetical protein
MEIGMVFIDQGIEIPCTPPHEQLKEIASGCKPEHGRERKDGVTLREIFSIKKYIHSPISSSIFLFIIRLQIKHILLQGKER